MAAADRLKAVDMPLSDIDAEAFREMQHKEAIVHAVLHANTEVLERYDQRYRQIHEDTHDRLRAVEDQGQVLQEMVGMLHTNQTAMQSDVAEIKGSVEQFRELLAPNRALDAAGRLPEFFLKNRMGQAIVGLSVTASLFASGKGVDAWGWIKMWFGWKG